MRRILFKLILVLFALLIVAVGLGAWLLNDEDFLKGQLSALTLKHAGRELTITGPLNVNLGRETRISAEGIRFANPGWAESPYMVSIGQLEVTIDLSTLFSRPRIPLIALQDCNVELLQNEDGDSNWAFSVDEAAEPEPEEIVDEDAPLLPVELQSISIERCTLFADSPDRHQPLDLRIDSGVLDNGGAGRVSSRIRGSINEENLEVDGWVMPVRAFVNGGEARFDLSAVAGNIGLESSGRFADAAALSGPEVEGRFHGPDIGVIIELFALPKFSEGGFDFSLELSTIDDGARIRIDGDLGSLQANADGTLDQIGGYSTGQVRVDVTGPDLGALAAVFGVEGVVPEPFETAATLIFDTETITINGGFLKTDGDRLNVNGRVSRAERLAGTTLTIALESDEAGRWAQAWGGERRKLGAVAVDGQVIVQRNGQIHVDAQADTGQSRLTAKGVAASMTGPPEPTLAFTFQTNELSRLAGLAGYDAMPDSPLSVAGRLEVNESAVRITGFDLSFDDSRATGDATLKLTDGFDGSEIDTKIDIPDLGALGQLFDVADLPAERLQVHAAARIEGDGLSFALRDGSLGENRIDAEGRIADLEEPASVDAAFDLHLPGLQFVKTWAPDLAIPEGPFEARGALRNRGDRVNVENIALAFNGAAVTLDGHFTREQQFDLTFKLKDPETANVNAFAELELPAMPLSVSGHAAGSPSAFSVQKIDFSYGETAATGDLSFQFEDTRKISGTLNASLLDLDWLAKDKPDDAPESETPERQKLFDDTPVQETTDIGIEIDTTITIDELRLSGARYESVEFGVLLTPTRLDVNPFRLTGFQGGTLDGKLLLATGGEAPRLEVLLDANDTKPGLAAAEGQDPETLPTIDLDLELQGSGRTYHELAAGLNGRVRARAGSGQLARSGFEFLLNDFLDTLLTTLNPFAERFEYSQLDCAVAAADIVDGQVRLAPVVFNLREITIVSEGDIDLETEVMDINFVSKPRTGLGISASDLVNPFIRVGGTLAQPALALDTTNTVVQGGLAVATGGLSILANAFSKRYLSSRDPCGDALREIEERDSR